MTVEAAKDVMSNGSSMLLYGAVIALGGRIIYDWLKGNRTQKNEEIIFHIRNTCNWLKEEHGRVKEAHDEEMKLLREMRDILFRCHPNKNK